MVRMVGTSGLDTSAYQTALVTHYIYVPSCGTSASVVQYVVVVQLRTIVPDVLLCPSFQRTLFLGRLVRRFVVYSFLQCIPLFLSLYI